MVSPAFLGKANATTKPSGLQTLRWSGGKRGGLADWIVSLLPAETASTYVEPYFGMGGVFFRRPRVRREVINDRNGRVTNWWRCVRDHGNELDRLVSAMPCSRQEYEWATAHLDDPELRPVERALAFFAVVNYSMTSSDQAPRFGPGYNCASGSVGCWKPGRVEALSTRLFGAIIENVDAIDLLETMAPRDYVVLYIDPPFPGTDNSAYQFGHLDVGRMTNLLQAQAGRVGISGIGNSWDHLGWVRNERTTTRRNRVGRNGPGSRAGERVDTLWCNFEPEAN